MNFNEAFSSDEISKIRRAFSYFAKKNPKENPLNIFYNKPVDAFMNQYAESLPITELVKKMFIDGYSGSVESLGNIGALIESKDNPLVQNVLSLVLSKKNELMCDMSVNVVASIVDSPEYQEYLDSFGIEIYTGHDAAMLESSEGKEKFRQDFIQNLKHDIHDTLKALKDFQKIKDTDFSNLVSHVFLAPVTTKSCSCCGVGYNLCLNFKTWKVDELPMSSIALEQTSGSTKIMECAMSYENEPNIYGSLVKVTSGKLVIIKGIKNLLTTNSYHKVFGLKKSVFEEIGLSHYSMNGTVLENRVTNYATSEVYGFVSFLKKSNLNFSQDDTGLIAYKTGNEVPEDHIFVGDLETFYKALDLDMKMQFSFMSECAAEDDSYVDIGSSINNDYIKERMEEKKLFLENLMKEAVVFEVPNGTYRVTENELFQDNPIFIKVEKISDSLDVKNDLKSSLGNVNNLSKAHKIKP